MLLALKNLLVNKGEKMNKLIVIMLVLLVRSVNANSIIAMPTERGLAERIKLVIDRGYITNDRLKQTLFESSGSNSNLLVRAAKRLCAQYDSNTNPVPYHVLYLIGSFGTTNDLPFVENYLTNAFTGLGAVDAYESINGYNQATIDATRKFLAVSNTVDEWRLGTDKANAVSSMLYRMQLFKPEGVDKNLFFSFGLECVSNKITTARSFDFVIDYLDPTFRYSKRRLELFRFLQTKPCSYVMTNYISKAISELVAYPESKLNE
jgi:hypothetical protein